MLNRPQLHGCNRLRIAAPPLRRIVLQRWATSLQSAGHVGWRSLVPIRVHGLEDLQFFLGDGCFFGLCPVRIRS
jgi:hypothetical protein